MVKLALQERVRQRIVEQAVEAPVRQIMEEVVEIVKEIHSERVFERGVEQVDVPVSRVVEQPAAEETMDVPVSRTQLRVVEEIIDVPVPHVMEETVETVKHIPLERVLNDAVEQSVDVPDPPIQEETAEVIPLTRQNQTPGRVRDETAEWNDDHKTFYEQFVKCMKPGIRENSVDDFEIAELLRFNTSKSGDEQISFKEYVDRMKEGQNDNYRITGESIALVSSSSFREYWRRKGYEVLHVADPVDENAVKSLAIDIKIHESVSAAKHRSNRSTQQRKQWQQPRKKGEEGTEEKGRAEGEKGRKGQRGRGQVGRETEGRRGGLRKEAVNRSKRT